MRRLFEARRLLEKIRYFCTFDVFIAIDGMGLLLLCNVLRNLNFPFFFLLFMRHLTITNLIEKRLVRRMWKKSEITILTINHTNCYTKTHIYWQGILSRITQYYRQNWFLISAILKQPLFSTANTSDIWFNYLYPFIGSICDIDTYTIYWHFLDTLF